MLKIFGVFDVASPLMEISVEEHYGHSIAEAAGFDQMLTSRAMPRVTV